MLSSIIFMLHSVDIESCKVCFAYGMQCVACMGSNYVQLHNTPQLLSYLLFQGISAVACELEQIISNQRMKLESLSSAFVQCCPLTWHYIVLLLQVPEHQLMTLTTFSKLNGRDLSTTRVKVRTPCKVLRVEDNDALLHVVSLFGVSSVIGVRKRPPKVARLRQHDVNASLHEGTFLTDSINVVDTTNNDVNPQRAFRLNANGRKGIDFMYYPEHNKMKLTLRYSSYVVATVKTKIIQFNLLNNTNQPNVQLSDNELEYLLNR